MNARGAAYNLWLKVQDFLAKNEDVTKTELSRRTGLSRPTIDRLEDGKRPPERATVKAIASVIGLDYNEALLLAGYPPPPTSSADVRRAILADPLLDPGQRRMMLDMYAAFERLNAQPEEETPRQRGAAGGERYRPQDGQGRRQVS